MRTTRSRVSEVGHVSDDEAMAMRARVTWLEQENADLREYIAAWHAWVRAANDVERAQSLATLLLRIDQRRRTEGTLPP